MVPNSDRRINGDRDSIAACLLLLGWERTGNTTADFTRKEWIETRAIRIAFVARQIVTVRVPQKGETHAK